MEFKEICPIVERPGEKMLDNKIHTRMTQESRAQGTRKVYSPP